MDVNYQGSQDWSLPYAASMTVTPGEIWSYSVWVKTVTNTNKVEFSVTTRDSSNNVLNWSHAYQSRTGVFDWQQVQTTFVVPPNCANIQFRFMGVGACDVYFDDADLERTAAAVQPLDISGQVFTISNGGTSLAYNGATGKFEIKKQSWPSGFIMSGPGNASLTAITPTSSSLDMRLESGAVVDELVSIDSSGDITMKFTMSGPVMGDMAFPGRLESAPGTSWVLPQNEGLLIPSNDTYYMPPFEKYFYMGHSGFCMPMLGLTDGARGILYIIETPDDAGVTYTAPAGGNTSAWQVVWQPSKGAFTYDRSMKVHLEDAGGYVSLAKAYRNYAALHGKAVTLLQKKAANPNLDLLMGAADIWWWQNAPIWSKDLNCTAAATEIKNSGFDRVLWSQEASGQAVDDMNAMGYLTGTYDIYQDSFDPANGISWEQTIGWPNDLVRDWQGNIVPGWLDMVNGVGYQGGKICSPREIYWADTRIPGNLSTHNYRARFIDTTTATELNECFDPNHPTTRSDDRNYKGQLLARIKDYYGMITGSETGIDWGAPYVHYFEGMMSIADYRVPNAGYDLTTYIAPSADYLRFQTGPFYRIPLFELVYHDCVVTTWYWGDASNRIPELWDDKDLYNCLYGTLPLYIMDPAIWASKKTRFVQSFNLTTAVTRRVGYEAMTKHEFITADHSVQCTEFSDGTRVCVNFGTAPYTLNNGIVLAAKGMTMTAAAGPTATPTPIMTPTPAAGLAPEAGKPPLVYPNPAKGHMNIFLPDSRSCTKVSVSLYTGSFRLISRTALDAAPENIYAISLKDMANGWYVVNVTLEKDGKQVYSNTQPFIVLN